MAGIDATKVLVGTPNQGTGTGAIRSAALGTAIPTNARTALTGTYAASGYISDDGVTISPDYSTKEIQDWSGATVRRILESFTGTVKYAHIQTDEFSAKDTFGADNVTVTAATATAGTQMTIKIGAHLPAPQVKVFEIKDGNALVRIVLPNSQVTKVNDIALKAGEPVGWDVEVSCYPDSTGNSIYIMTDDGVFSS